MTVNAPLEVSAAGAPIDEEALLERIRAQDEAGALALVVSSPVVSLRIVRGAFAHELPALVDRLAHLALEDATGAYAFLQWLTSNVVLMGKIYSSSAWWPGYAKWTTRLLSHVPAGWQRIDAAKKVFKSPSASMLSPGATVRGSRTALFLELDGLVVSMQTKGHFTKVEVEEAGSAGAQRLLAKAKPKKARRMPKPPAVSEAVAKVLGGPVRAQIARLGATFPDAVPEHPGTSPSIAVLRATDFAGSHRLIHAGSDDGFAFYFTLERPVLDLPAAHEPPLFELGYSEGELHVVLKADDASADPTVFTFDADDFRGLEDGQRLSAFLRRIVRDAADD